MVRVIGSDWSWNVVENETSTSGRPSSLAQGDLARVQQVRARGRSGHWLTVQGTPLGEGGQVAIMMEPSRPLEVASLILEAYGLTQREGELVHCVLQGFDTEQIARGLG